MTESAVQAHDAEAQGTSDRASIATSDAAESLFDRLESLYGAFMALTTTNWIPPSRSRQDFDRWVTAVLTPSIQYRQELLSRAQDGYMHVIALHIPRWEMAAAYRLASMYLSFARNIRSRRLIPPDVDPNHYMQNPEDRTQPFVNTAATGFQSCLWTGTAVQATAVPMRRCAQALAEIDRERFPVDDEVVPELRSGVPMPSVATTFGSAGVQSFDVLEAFARQFL